jgi:hypothetical protein
MSECTCRDVHLNRDRETVGKNIDEDCPLHGIGTDYYAAQAEKWNARLRELRAKRQP